MMTIAAYNPQRAHRAFVGWIGLCVLMALGCVNLKPDPEMAVIYNRAAQHRSPLRHPVIVIPGILGTKLMQANTDTIVWGAFGGKSINPEKPDGARLLAVPMGRGQALGELRDVVEPAGALERVQVSLLGLPVTLNAYINILSTLGAAGYLDEQLALAKAVDYGDDHYSCFQFDYDWRRDNVENAKRLHAFILEKKTQVQREIERRFGIKDHDVKFDIVAHSMGGLMTRYYLRYGDADLPEDGSLPQITWAGARHVGRAVFVGTPNAGSLKSLDQLVHGAKFASFLPSVSPAILGTMPSIYQLLPRGRHHVVKDAANHQPVTDLYDPRLWQEMSWGLADAGEGEVLKMLMPTVDDRAARRRIALDHQRKCLVRAKRFTAALDAPATPPPPDGLGLYLFAGDAKPTASHAVVDRSTGSVQVVDHSPGDGTVTRASALMDERLGNEWQPQLRSPIRWQQVFFLFTDHLGLTKDNAFSDNVLYLLLEDPRS